MNEGFGGTRGGDRAHVTVTQMSAQSPAGYLNTAPTPATVRSKETEVSTVVPPDYREASILRLNMP